MKRSVIALLSVLLTTHFASGQDPFVVVQIGEQAPGLEPGTFFEEVSAPAVTQDGQRVAFMAKLTGNRKSWWFGDLQPDGFYDLKVAAISGREGTGAAGTGTLILDWLPDPNAFGNERPLYTSTIHLDPVTGKLAFLGYLSNRGTENLVLFIADEEGINLVMEEGIYPEYSYIFSDELIPFAIKFSEIKYNNDRLAFSSVGLNPFWFTRHFSVFSYEEGKIVPILLAPEDSPSYQDPILGDLTAERLGPLALSADGVIAFIVDGRIPYPGINNDQMVSLVLASLPDSSSLRTVAAKWDYLEGFAFDARIADFSELSINRNNDILIRARCFEVDEAGLPKSYEVDSNISIFLSDISGLGLYQNVQQTFDIVALDVAKLASVTSLKNIQTAGNYVAYTGFFSGEANGLQTNVSLFRQNYTTGLAETVFYAGGPSHIDGLGTVYGIDHAYLGPFGDIIAQITTDDGFRRTLVHVAPPDDDDIVRYRALADSYSFSYFDCEFSCDGFTPLLPNLYFPSPLNNPTVAYGPEAGDTPWVNFYKAGWIINSGFGVDRSEYSVLLDLDPIFVDYGDAPHKPLTPAPIDVPTGYVEASHVIDEAMFLGTEIDNGLREKDANLRYRYFGLGDDIPDINNAEDDEDGVFFNGAMQSFDVALGGATVNVSYPAVVLGANLTGTLYASAPSDRDAYVSAWVDFNRNGDFDSTERVINSMVIPAGTFIEAFPFEILLNQARAVDVGFTFARFRISGRPNILPEGREDSGEVEDYLIYFGVAMDYGDAPQEVNGLQYPTRLVFNGARHTSLINTPILGASVDYEMDGAPDVAAEGDDTSGSDDEDGIVFPPVMLPGQTIDLLATASMAGKLDGWIDFNQDGDWSDDGEQILDSVDVVEGENALPVSIPGDAKLGTTYARFRISSGGGLLPTGLAQGGEVEDYRIELKFPPIGWDFLDPGQGQVRLFWDGPVSIEGAPTPFGPWAPLESSPGEYLHTIGEASQFFRLVPELP